MRKSQSTNTQNLKELIVLCPISYTISLIGGRWKPLVIDRLLKRSMRYSELKRSIPPVTERMLTIQLKEMERDGLIGRTVHEASVPKIVEYHLTALGLSLERVLHELFSWGKMHQQQNIPSLAQT